MYARQFSKKDGYMWLIRSRIYPETTIQSSYPYKWKLCKKVHKVSKQKKNHASIIKLL